MARYEIRTEDSTIDVRFKPGLKGLGVRVTGLRGWFDATLGADGEVDFGAPIEGRFQVAVDQFDMGHPIATHAARLWLAGETEMAVVGVIAGVEPTGPRSFRSTCATEIKGRAYMLDAVGTIELHEGDALHVRGTTLLHPRDVGVPVPRRLFPKVEVLWTIFVRPDEAAEEPS